MCVSVTTSDSQLQSGLRMNIAIYIYENAEVLDFSGPYEVFSTAARFLDKGAYQVFLVAEQAGVIRARGGFQVLPQYSFSDCPAVDVLVVAGGIHSAEMEKPAVLEWLGTTAASAQLVASVCTGAFLLAGAGVLDDQQVTTHWEDQADLQARFPALDVLADHRWVDAGFVVTSGGISAGIDMSLYLVQRLFDRHLAEKTARQMEFDWSAAPI